MKLTEKQAWMLYQIAFSSLNIVNTLAFTQDDRSSLVNEILNQQDNKQFMSLTPQLSPLSEEEK